jgi:hypothetical protein
MSVNKMALHKQTIDSVIRRKIMRRIAAVATITFVVLLIAGVAAFESNGRTGLRESNEQTVLTLAQDVERALEIPVADVTNLAENPLITQYARLLSANPSASFTGDDLQLQTDVLRLFNDLILHRGRDFRAIRYVLPDGRRRGEVIQRGVTSDIVTDISSELFTADPTLQEAFSLGQIGEVYLSPVISNGTSETLFLYE